MCAAVISISCFYSTHMEVTRVVVKLFQVLPGFSDQWVRWAFLADKGHQEFEVILALQDSQEVQADRVSWALRVCRVRTYYTGWSKK